MSDYLAGVLLGWSIGAVAMWLYFHTAGLIKTEAQYIADRWDKEAKK